MPAGLVRNLLALPPNACMCMWEMWLFSLHNAARLLSPRHSRTSCHHLLHSGASPQVQHLRRILCAFSQSFGNTLDNRGDTGGAQETSSGRSVGLLCRWAPITP